MASVVTKIDQVIKLGTGVSLTAGTFTFTSSYAAGGEVLDLTNVFPTATVPAVILSPAAGYTLASDKGTAGAGKILAYQFVANTTTVNSVALNTPLYQVHTGADLSAVNCAFYAIGQAY